MPRTATKTPEERIEAQRASERRSRERRIANLKHMRSQLEALEVAALVLRTVNDNDGVWDGFLDKESNRVRYYLRRQLQLTKEVKMLMNEQTQIQRLLTEHQLWTEIMTGYLQEEQVDEWTLHGTQWHEIARRHFQPWFMDACKEEMNDALKEIFAFQWSTDKQTSGLSFMGWRESRRVDSARGVFQFQFSKPFWGYEVMDYVNCAWDIYTVAELYDEVIIGPQGNGHHEILQQLSPNVVIIRGAERYPALDVDIHFVYLVFRVKTATGFIQCVRSISAPELVQEIQHPRAVWPSNFIWMQWDVLENGERGYKMKIGGRMGEIEVNYATLWMVGVLGAVLRSEVRATGRKLITSD